MHGTVERIAVASLNPVKVGAVRATVGRCLPDAAIIECAAPPGLPAMPLSDEECLAAARARAAWALATTDADLALGLEGGVQPSTVGLLLTGWVVATHRDGRVGVGGGGRLPVPDLVAVRLLAGEELGDVMDDLLGVTGSKQERGAVGALTAGLIDRQQTFAQAVACALAPFVAPHLYEASATPLSRRGQRLRTVPGSDGTDLDGTVVIGCCNLVCEDETYLLVRESSPSSRGRYNLPGGKPEVGETLIEAAVREANEEAGIRVAVDHLVGIYQCPETSEGFGVTNFVFAARRLAGDLSSSEKHPEVRFFSRTALEALAATKMLRGTHILRVVSDHERGQMLPLSAVQVVESSE